MNILRRTSTVRLVIAVLVIAIVSGATAYAVSTRSGPKPPPRSLAAAIHTALMGKPVSGVMARVAFTNHLLQTGLPGAASSPLVTGATGRVWAGDGRLRLELQASTGDTEIGFDGRRLTVYDVASNTAYVMALRQGGWHSYPGDAGTRHVPSVTDIRQMLQPLLQHAMLTGPVPTNIGGRPAYTVRVSPRHSAGLLGSVELGWDAAHGVPLKIAVYSQGDSSPVLSLKATSISFGRVPASDLHIPLAPGAKVMHVTAPTHMDAGGHGAAHQPEVSGARTVAHALAFPLSAPAQLVGVPRQTVRLVASSDSKGAMVVYGRGLGAILVLEEPVTGGSGQSPMSALPSVAVHGATAHELSTALGTALQWDRGGVRYTLIGSLPAPAAEAAARALG